MLSKIDQHFPLTEIPEGKLKTNILRDLSRRIHTLQIEMSSYPLREQVHLLALYQNVYEALFSTGVGLYEEEGLLLDDLNAIYTASNLMGIHTYISYKLKQNN